MLSVQGNEAGAVLCKLSVRCAVLCRCSGCYFFIIVYNRGSGGK